MGLVKQCAGCGWIMEKPRNTSRGDWAMRQFCSVKCGAQHRAKRASRPLSERFWEKVDKSSSERGCWLWIGSADQHGYGKIRRGGRGEGNAKAHRISWELANGPIPSGLGVMHKCDNPPCVNPDHLRLGTQKDNIADCSRKGRTGPRQVAGERNPSAKLSRHQVDDIRRSHSAGLSYAQLGQQFGVHPTTIGLIIRGARWQEGAAS